MLAVVIVAIRVEAQTDPYLAEEAPDVQLTPLIQQKAAELGNDPVRIYQFVRNELRYESYFGAMKGPQGALLSRGANDYDSASLLVSLLRAAGTPARFARGRVKIPLEDALALTGATTGGAEVHVGTEVHLGRPQPTAWDASPVANLVWSEPNFEMLRIWVEALVPVARYRGKASGSSTAGKAWLALDPGFKLANWTPDPGLPLGQGALEFEYMRPTGLYSKVFPKLPVEIYEGQVLSYLASQHSPGTTPAGIESVLFTGKLREASVGLLPTSLPYDLDSSVPTARSASLEQLHSSPLWTDSASGGGAVGYRTRYSIHVCETSAGSACETLSLGSSSKLIEASDWSGNWETRQVVLSFPPDPGSPDNVPDTGYSACDGTDGQPIVTRPKIAIDGADISPPGTSTIPLCSEVSVVVLAEPVPAAPTSRSQHTVGVGGVYVPVLESNASGPQEVALAAESLLGASDTFPLEVDAATGRMFVDDATRNGEKEAGEEFFARHFEAREAHIGGLLHLAEVWYADATRSADRRLASIEHLRELPRTHAGLVSAGTQIGYAFDIPFSVQPSNLLIDVKSGWFAASTRDGVDAALNMRIFDLRLHQHSALEHAVWEELVGFEAISTVKGFQLAEEGTARHVRILNGPADALNLTDECTNSNCDEEDIDQNTYCQLIYNFGESSVNEVSAWSCAPGALPGTTQELRILNRSLVSWNGFAGFVYLRRYDLGGSQRQSMTISPSGAGGIRNDVRDLPWREYMSGRSRDRSIRVRRIVRVLRS